MRWLETVVSYDIITNTSTSTTTATTTNTTITTVVAAAAAAIACQYSGSVSIISTELGLVPEMLIDLNHFFGCKSKKNLLNYFPWYSFSFVLLSSIDILWTVAKIQTFKEHEHSALVWRQKQNTLYSEYIQGWPSRYADKHEYIQDWPKSNGSRQWTDIHAWQPHWWQWSWHGHGLRKTVSVIKMSWYFQYKRTVPLSSTIQDN